MSRFAYPGSFNPDVQQQKELPAAKIAVGEEEMGRVARTIPTLVKKYIAGRPLS